MAGDAELAADRPPHPVAALTVDGVGVVQARRPQPAAVVALAQAANPDLTDDQRNRHLLHGFLLAHLGPGEYERLLTDMMGEDGLPPDTVRLVTAAVAEWGTARRYQTIIELAVVAGQHWRTIRTRLLSAGIADPMRTLPHMHAVLDVAEQLLTPESLQRIYRPAALGKEQAPPGFTAAEIDASLDAFAAFAGENDDDA